mgnify:FL=1
MTASKLENKENTRPQITHTETYRKTAKRLSNCLCGIAFIVLGLLSAKLTGDATAAIMLFVMGLAAVFSK